MANIIKHRHFDEDGDGNDSIAAASSSSVSTSALPSLSYVKNARVAKVNAVNEQDSTAAAAAAAAAAASIPERNRRRNGRSSSASIDKMATLKDNALSDDSDSDDAPPEAVEASKAKAQERQRVSKRDDMNKATKQARRKREASSSQAQKVKRKDSKGKGKAVIPDENEDEIEDEDKEDNALDNQEQESSISAERQISTITSKNVAKHRTFNDNDDNNLEDEEEEGESTNSSKAIPRLDPNLFQQAEEALQSARKNAALKSQRNSNLTNDESTTNSQSKQFRKRKNTSGSVTKVIGDTTIQQLQPISVGDKAAVDPTTALTSQRSENFLKDRLYKRKRAKVNRLQNDNKHKAKEEKPHLLFDPLLDKPDSKQSAKKALTRAEMEERLRFRKPAQQAYLKSRKTLGPSLTFAAPRVTGRR